MGRSSYGRILTNKSLLCYKSNKSTFLPTNIHNHRLIHQLNHLKQTTFSTPNTPFSSPHCHHFFPIFSPFFSKPTSIITYFRNLSTGNDDVEPNYQSPDGSDEEVEPIESWEEEDDTEPEIGDGADGGGIALQNCSWGERALSIAREVLLEFDEDVQLYAFKTSPRGYIYVRLDKLSHEYGCPNMEEIESYSRSYKKRLDELGASGDIPDDLALEVSSPSAERLLRVPDDLHRFKDMPMRVSYVDDVEGKCQEKNGVFLLDLINADTETITWRLANVKENRDPLAKGRPMSRKQKDWRLELPFTMSKREVISNYPWLLRGHAFNPILSTPPLQLL